MTTTSRGGGRPVIGSARGVTAVLVLVLAATVAVPASASAVSARTLYAYADGTGDPAGCAATTTPASGCSFGDALSHALAGDTIALATPGKTAHYVGNWTVSTTGTSATTPVTIAAAPGLTSVPTLDGNSGSANGCSTADCAGSILTIAAGVSVAVRGISFSNGHTTGNGGAIDVGDGSTGSTLHVSDSSFLGNNANGGGAISASNRGTASVVVSDSFFLLNSAQHGGAIDSASGGVGGTLTVQSSTFYANQAHDDGGAIDSVDYGTGALTVRGSTFGSNVAFDGGAIDHADEGDGPAVISTSTFDGNSAVRGGAIGNGLSGLQATMSVVGSTFVRDTVGVRVIGTAAHKVAVASFVVDGMRTEDVGRALDRCGIAVRSGHHCAQPALRRFGVETSVRASLAFYNTENEIEVFAAALRRIVSQR